METQNKERVKQLLADTMILLCKNGIHYNSEFSINALIGITVDRSDVILISINETLHSAEMVKSVEAQPHKLVPVLCHARRPDTEGNSPHESTCANEGSCREKHVDDNKLVHQPTRHSVHVAGNDIKKAKENVEEIENTGINDISHNYKIVNVQSDVSGFPVKEELIAGPDCTHGSTWTNDFAINEVKEQNSKDVRFGVCTEVQNEYGRGDTNGSSHRIIGFVDNLGADRNLNTAGRGGNSTVKRMRNQSHDSVRVETSEMDRSCLSRGETRETDRSCLSRDETSEMDHSHWSSGDASEMDRTRLSRKGCTNTSSCDQDNSEYVIHDVDDSDEEDNTDDSNDDDVESCIFVGKDFKTSPRGGHVASPPQNLPNYQFYNGVPVRPELSNSSANALNSISGAKSSAMNVYRATLPKDIPTKKKRKSRISFTLYQIKCLEEVFLRTQYPEQAERQFLCQNLNLGSASIKVWFKNRRAKFKKDYLYPIAAPIIWEMPEVISDHAKRKSDWWHKSNAGHPGEGEEPVCNTRGSNSEFNDNTKTDNNLKMNFSS